MKDVLEYQSRDFYLSACLLATGAPLLRLQKQSNNLYLFVFKISEKGAGELINRHWNRQLKIPTKSLIDAINELKTRIHNGY